MAARPVRDATAALAREDGGGMVLVLLVLLVMSSFVTVALASGQSTERLSRKNQDRQAALAAAEAGVDDYVYRLNRNDQYWQFSATNPPSTDPGSASYNAAIMATSPTNPAAGWAAVPGGASDGAFHYEYPPAPRNPATTVPVDGTVSVRVTGRARGQTRTLEVVLRKRSVLDNLYFTDFETLDPGAYGQKDFSYNPGAQYNPTQPSPGVWRLTAVNAQAWANANCRVHRWEGRSPDCTPINFIGNSTMRDVIRGPFHTNDTFSVRGTPEWTQRATTSDPSGTYLDSLNPATSAPTFPPGSPSYRTSLDLPPSNTQIRLEADRSATPSGQGCLYTGPTEIILQPTTPGTMLVRSPYTPASHASLNAGCIGANPDVLTQVNLPANGVIFVQPSSGPCTVTQTAGQPERNPLGYPIAEDITAYGCLAGDVFVRGQVRGQLTIATANNITITGHVEPANRANGDILGLVAQNYVQVYHPVRCTAVNSAGLCTAGTNLTPASGAELDNPNIGAAILSMTHSFRVQNNHLGAVKGTLNVTGVIAQLFRGPVATSTDTALSTGYAKNYVYDERLAYLSPPSFIDPVESPWQQKSQAEIAPRY